LTDKKKISFWIQEIREGGEVGMTAQFIPGQVAHVLTEKADKRLRKKKTQTKKKG